MEAVARKDPADRSALMAGIAWGVLYIIARLGLETVPHGSWAAVTLALLPIPAFAAALWFFIRAVRGADELERRIHLEALALAFPLSVLMLMVLGLLDMATDLDPADWSYRHLWPFMTIFWLAGMALARRRYS